MTPSSPSTSPMPSLMVPPCSGNAPYTGAQLCQDTEDLTADIHDLLVSAIFSHTLVLTCAIICRVGKSDGIESSTE